MALDFVSGFIVSSLLQEFVERVRASVTDTINLACSWDVEEELKDLEASYINVLSMLHNIDGWDLITSQPHQNWVGDVWRVCYEINDFTQLLRVEILEKIEDANFVTSLWTKWGVSRRQRDLQNELNRVISLSDNFASRNGRFTERKAATILEPMRAPDDESFRRKRDKDDIIGFLIRPTSTVSSSSRSSSRDNSSIVLISGMFGIGKTALAQVVKNDSRIHGSFDHRLWVSVSGDFNLAEALRSIIKDLQEEDMQQSFYGKISPRSFKGLCKGRRVLIVLDDLCSFPGYHDWEEFQSLLLDCSCIFGVIITTRNPKVAATVESLSVFPTVTYCLQTMSDEDCQLVILNKAVSAGLYNISKRRRCGKSSMKMNALNMAERFCNGLPLIADFIGQQLCSKPDSEWTNMLSQDLWNLPEFKQRIFPSFRLNYSDLSLFLKKSLPYFSLFPENYNFKEDELIQLWLAEGLIEPQVPGFHCMELPGMQKLGSYYFDEVLSQSILQIYHPFNHGSQIYRMHKFIRRYAQYIGSGMYVSLDQQFVHACSSFAFSSTQYRNARHLSLPCQNISLPIWKDIEKCEGLRTILSLHERTLVGEISDRLFLKLQSLRVLHLRGTDITELPETIGTLKHLRFLDVSRTRIEELPSSIVDLHGLQVLKLDHCELLLPLPKGIENLTQLLHLEVDVEVLKSMPPHIGNLINLYTLPAFFVRRKDGYRITELKGMKYLQGSICLARLQNVEDEAEAREAMLSKKPFLKRVELKWDRKSHDQSLAERILTSLKPHENLEELQVTGYDGTQFPGWLSNAECKLTSIQLLKCRCCRILPALGQLQHLVALHIEGMQHVEYVNHQFSGSGLGAGFPALELLKFKDMTSLTRWDGLQDTQMPCLRDLIIEGCSQLIALPSLNLLTSLVKLEVSCCPALQALPEQGLPFSLKKLIIQRSDFLKQCCLPECQGTDWEKIRAVPEVFIDGVQIPTSARES